MGYIYEAIDRAKEAIAKSFEESVKYKNIFEIIDQRLEFQLHQQLHAARHYLNPEYFYQDPAIENFREVMNGLYACIKKLVPSIEVQDKILPLYTRAEGNLDFSWQKDQEQRDLQIYSKKRNILEHKRLNDLVYVKYNYVLRTRFHLRNIIDPISLDHVDHSNEWLVGEMEVNFEAENELVFGGDDIDDDVDSEESEEEDIEGYNSSDTNESIQLKKMMTV
ncbi:uncharacterized protein [Nicotiana sylvestris]|uniref:Uncharacterized protein LOC104217374 n=1 Tax=Nicotiana sylvestris TaxID=4096 RepID=A0A1U7VLR9_NICSY|nr:PREDICTED: uncharacterized protein LOC104217374 [Nicotiana sylvestris]